MDQAFLAMDQDKRMTYEEMQGYFDDALIQGGIKAIEITMGHMGREDGGITLICLDYPFL